MPELRHREGRDHADRCLPVFLRLHGLRYASATESRGLLCVLLLWFGAVPTYSSWRDADLPAARIGAVFTAHAP